MIFISGKIIGSYRAQNILKALADNKKTIIYLPWKMELPRTWNKLLVKLIRPFLFITFFPLRILLILCSTQLIVLPMNTNKYSLLDVLIARLARKKVIYEYYISRYDSSINDTKSIQAGTWRASIELFYDKAFTYFSTHIVCLNDAEVVLYKPYMSKNIDHKIRAIPLVIDPITNINKQIEDPHTINYCWWGTYIPLHGLENLINGFNLSDNKNAKLWIFGDIEKKSKKFQQLVKELGIEEKVIFNHEYTFKNGKLPDFLLSHQVVSIGLFGTSNKAKSVLINKIVDSCALSLPVLTAETEASKLFFEDHVNIMYSSREALGVSKKMNLINCGQIDLNIIGTEANKVYVENFSPEVFQQKYMQVVNESCK